MKRAILVYGIVLLLILTGTEVAFAQGEGGPDAAGIMDVALVLAPLAATALGIERLVETGWGLIETILSFIPWFDFIKKEEANLDDKDKKNKAGYKKFKVWTSAAIGIGLGIWVANAAGLKMFNLIGLEVIPEADVLVTGLVVGSGSKFTHDVIGIFTETKRLIENGAELLKRK
jgi:hypothetical protein